jgi:arabinogalactan endo-1,4-beta-galactosidase
MANKNTPAWTGKKKLYKAGKSWVAAGVVAISGVVVMPTDASADDKTGGDSSAVSTEQTAATATEADVVTSGSLTIMTQSAASQSAESQVAQSATTQSDASDVVVSTTAPTTGYYFDGGEMNYLQNQLPVASGWVDDGRAYIDPQQGMVFGLRTINGLTYAFGYQDGDLKTQNGMTLRASMFEPRGYQKRIGWQEINGKVYYFGTADETGNTRNAAKTGLQTIDGQLFYFNADGTQVKNSTVVVSGHTDSVGTDGVVQLMPESSAADSSAASSSAESSSSASSSVSSASSASSSVASSSAEVSSSASSASSAVADTPKPNQPVITPWIGDSQDEARDLATNDTVANKAARANKSISIFNSDGGWVTAVFDENGDKYTGVRQFGDKTIDFGNDGWLSQDQAYKYGFDTGLRTQEVTIPKIDGMVDSTIRGVDASSYQALKDAGVKFYDNDGNEKPLMQILAESGVNYMRIRIFNDPKDANGNTYGGGNNDAAQALKIAQEAKKYGMNIMLDFMYSDFWADPSQQVLPKAWAGLSGEALQQKVYEYTKQVLTDFKNAGITPNMVQVGNEITNGLLSGGTTHGAADGSTKETSWADTQTAAEMSAFLSAGSKAVRELAPAAQIALQLESPNIDRFRTILNAWAVNGVDYDVLASSYYPTYSDDKNNATNLEAVQDLAADFGKGFLVAEVAQANSESDGDGQNNVLGDTYLWDDQHPASPQGQVDVLSETYQTILSNSNNNGLGAFYWEPAWVPVFAGYDNWWYNKTASEKLGTGWASWAAEGYLPDRNMYWVNPDTGVKQETWGGSSWDNAGLFDINGVALKSLDFYKDSLTGEADYKVIRVDIINADGTTTSNFYHVPVDTVSVNRQGEPVLRNARMARAATQETATLSERNVATFNDSLQDVVVDDNGTPIANEAYPVRYEFVDVTTGETVQAYYRGMLYYTRETTDENGNVSRSYVIGYENAVASNTGQQEMGMNSILLGGPLTGYDYAFDAAKIVLTGDPDSEFTVIIPVRAQTWTENPDGGYGSAPSVPDTPTTPSTVPEPENPSTTPEPETPSTTPEPENPSVTPEPETPSTAPEPETPSTPTEPVTPTVTTPNTTPEPEKLTPQVESASSEAASVPWTSVETVGSASQTVGGVLAYTATPATDRTASALPYVGTLPQTSAEQQQKRWLVAGVVATAAALTVFALGLLIDRKRQQ